MDARSPRRRIGSDDPFATTAMGRAFPTRWLGVALAALFVQGPALGCRDGGPLDAGDQAPSADRPADEPASGKPGTPEGSSESSARTSPKSGSPGPAVARVCALAPCAGNRSTVKVWRDASGRAATFEHEGQLGSCSHPPTTFFDPSGRLVAKIPLVPVEPGSPKQRELAATRKRATEGLVADDPVRCGEATGKSN